MSNAAPSSHLIPALALSLIAACANKPAASPRASERPPSLAVAPLTVVDTTSVAATPMLASVASLESAEVIDSLTPAIDQEVEDEGEDSGEIPEDRDGAGVDPGLRYTAELTDEDLSVRWQTAPDSLGPISIGFSDEGRLINAEPFPRGDGLSWSVVSPGGCWGTSETIAYVTAAAERVKALHPNAPPLRVNDISLKEGGWFRPHRSHQSGRDVDLGFYYSTPEAPRCGACEKVMDPAPNWELVKSLVMLGDVQVILVDRRVQDVLYAHALSIGEDREWLDSLLKAGADSLVKHARRHRNHFHVRFFNPRAQELGRRVAPLLAQRPDQNLRIYRVRNGDNLGKIALRNRSSIRAIQKANRMRGTFLRIGQVLRVPMRGPCTKCPVPPPLEVPPRRLPPAILEASTGGPDPSVALNP